eukprot:scaffold78212_cov56-Phaeocystis_antarctica.AAC.1
MLVASRSGSLPNDALFDTIAFLVLILLLSTRRACQVALGVPLLTHGAPLQRAPSHRDCSGRNTVLKAHLANIRSTSGLSEICTLRDATR